MFENTMDVVPSESHAAKVTDGGVPPMSDAARKDWIERHLNKHDEPFGPLLRWLEGVDRERFEAIQAFWNWCAKEYGPNADAEPPGVIGDGSYVDLLPSAIHPGLTVLDGLGERQRRALSEALVVLEAWSRFDASTNRWERWEDLQQHFAAIGRTLAVVYGTLIVGHGADAHAMERLWSGVVVIGVCRDISIDFGERDHLYLPLEWMPDDTCERRLRKSIKQGYGVDHEILGQSSAMIRRMTAYGWELLEEGAPVLESLQGRWKILTDLIGTRAQMFARTIDMWNHETALYQPSLILRDRAKLHFGTRFRLRREERS